MFNCKYIFNINEKKMKYLITKKKKKKTRNTHMKKYSIKINFLLKEKQEKLKQN